MDPQGRDDMLDLIKRIHRMLGISLIVSSHILEDVERVCDYVVILSDGKLVLAQPIEGLGTERGDLLVRVDGDVDAFIGRLAGVGVHAARGAGAEWTARDELVIRHDGDHVYDAVRDAAADLGVGLRSLRKRVQSLEDIYIGEVERPVETGDADGDS
jgi:ABC-2 type transport system ATP-binding protein